MSDRTRVELKNDLAELDRLAGELEAFGARNGLPEQLVLELNLVLEEIVTNIVSYGYDDEAEHLIGVELELADGELRTRVEDDGKPFDPLQQELPDTSVALEEREVGGLGVLLVRRLMDEVSYQRARDRNVLEMTKRVTLK